MAGRARLADEFFAELDVDAKLRADGLVDDNGLTPAGELRLLQLRTLKWMAEHPCPQWRRKS